MITIPVSYTHLDVYKRQDNYAAKLMLEAKTVKPINSRIMKSLDKLAGFTGKIIIPFRCV